MTRIVTERDRLRHEAHKLVRAAIKEGTLLPPTDGKCVDCGEPGYCYDHRDYRKPLCVQIVCRACNNRRGPGLPLPAPEDNSEYKTLLTGSSGQRWSGVEAGDGFEPLIARLNGLTEHDLDHLSERSETLESEALAMEMRTAIKRNSFRLSGYRGGFSNPTGIARAEFFKRRDPWYA